MPPKLFQDLQLDHDDTFNDSDADNSNAPLSSLRARVGDFQAALAESDAASVLSGVWSATRTTAVRVGLLAGQAAWILATSALVVAVPLIFEVDRELGETADSESAAPRDAQSKPAASQS